MTILRFAMLNLLQYFFTLRYRIKFGTTMVFVLSLATLSAQSITTLRFDTLLHAGINPAGELYAVTANSIVRFDKSGEELNKVQLPHGRSVTQFEAWHLTQLVLYIRDKQQIEIYDPALELRDQFTIDPAFAVEPSFIALSFDQQHLWIVDKADGSLKWVKHKTGEVLTDEIITVFDATKETIRSIREYQRFLFVQTSTGIYAFNSLGKHVRTFPTADAFDFFGEELVLTSNGQAAFTSLLTDETRSISVPRGFSHYFISDERLFAVRGNSIEIFTFNAQ